MQRTLVIFSLISYKRLFISINNVVEKCQFYRKEDYIAAIECLYHYSLQYPSKYDNEYQLF